MLDYLLCPRQRIEELKTYLIRWILLRPANVTGNTKGGPDCYKNLKWKYAFIILGNVSCDHQELYTYTTDTQVYFI